VVLQLHRLAVHADGLGRESPDPQSRLFAVLVWADKVVVAGAERNAARPTKDLNVLLDDDALRLQRHRRGDVQAVAGYDDEVKVRPYRNEPVQLR
jgi:hypothetical protein